MTTPRITRESGIPRADARFVSVNVVRLLTVLLLAIGLSSSQAYSQSTFYWTTGDQIRSVVLVVPEDLVTGLASPRGLALDVEAGRMYWITENTIRRARLDGTDVEDLVTGLASPGALALDPQGEMMYWSNNGMIRRATLDGANVEDLIANYTSDLALDVARGKMYWTWTGSNVVRRANLDGSDVEDLEMTRGFIDAEGQIIDDPFEIALDVNQGKLYWATTFVSGGYDPSRDAQHIIRADLDGSNAEGVYSQFGFISGISVDATGGKLYWVDQDYSRQREGLQIEAPVLQRANLDGSDVENLLAGQRSPEDMSFPFHGGGTTIALDVDGGMLYWTVEGKIKRVSLAGTRLRNLVTGLETPWGLVLDRDGGTLYWTDPGAGKIQRANRDGSDVEDLVTGLEAPRNMVLDGAAGTLYWTDSEAGKIQRANLDGSEMKDLLTGLGSPWGLALDAGEGRLYWTDRSERKIHRAGLDGSEVEDLVIGQEFFELALDVAAGTLYATDYESPPPFDLTERINGLNLDGSGLEGVGDCSDFVGGLALETAQNRLYFGYSNYYPAPYMWPSGIGFINLDGSGCELVFDMLGIPRGIALELDDAMPLSTALPIPAPAAYHFSAAYPNPFTSATRFTLLLNQPQPVRLEVFDLLGRRVALLYEGMLGAAQRHVFSMGAGSLPSGVYLIRALGERFTTTRQVILLK